MTIHMNQTDIQLLKRVQKGLPLSPRPYESLGRELGLGEEQVLQRLSHFLETGILKRLGVVVRHRPLGYASNGMVVWDIPQDHLEDVAANFSRHPFVTLCYQRPRVPGKWRFNLFCMIHGKSRRTVSSQAEQLCLEMDLPFDSYEILFSRRCFKQRGPQPEENEVSHVQ